MQRRQGTQSSQSWVSFIRSIGPRYSRRCGERPRNASTLNRMKIANTKAHIGTIKCNQCTRTMQVSYFIFPI
ncbi:hypothetical protein Hanom_Chr06g00496861 [Helianthus anomalus]